MTLGSEDSGLWNSLDRPSARPGWRARGQAGPGMRSVFNCCLALMMVEAGKAKLVETRPGEPVPTDRLGTGMIGVSLRRGP